MGDEDSKEPKKDLTGILDLPQAEPGQSGEGSADEFLMDEAQPEQIQEFETIEELPPMELAAEPEMEAAPEVGITPEMEAAPEIEPASDDLALQLDEVPVTDAAPELDASPMPEPSVPETALDEIRNTAQNIPIGTPQVEAAFPFSLMIEGLLTMEEREKLLDLLSTHQMGIREMDLEPQLEEGRILIPRISEYAGVLIVQALRSAHVKMRLAPSDEIFATDDTRNTGEELAHPIRNQQYATSLPSHPAERIPMTTLEKLPGALGAYRVIDVVTASALLKSAVVEAERSSEYQELLEALKRELRYKAHRKGANAILNLGISLTQLTSPSQFRLMVTGSAVKVAESPGAPLGPELG